MDGNKCLCCGGEWTTCKGSPTCDRRLCSGELFKTKCVRCDAWICMRCEEAQKSLHRPTFVNIYCDECRAQVGSDPPPCFMDGEDVCPNPGQACSQCFRSSCTHAPTGTSCLECGKPWCWDCRKYWNGLCVSCHYK